MFTTRCKTCLKEFSTSGRGPKPYCSDQCASITCQTCGNLFVPDRRTPPRKFCSNKCRGIAYLKSWESNPKYTKNKIAHKICEGCGKLFSISGENFSARAAKAKFCSRDCYFSSEQFTLHNREQALARRGKGLPKIVKGSERWHKGQYLIWVSADDRLGRWKRKSVHVLEQAFGRPLTRSELQSIKHLDGDKSNCSLDNLFITPGKWAMTECKLCGKPKVIQASGRRSDSEVKYCFDCYTQIILPERQRKMRKISDWKSLLEQHDKLKAQAGATLHSRIVLLVKVYENKEYIDYTKSQNKTATELLDKKVSDTCARFIELFHMLKLFPRKDQWKDGDLSDMRQKMLSNLKNKSKDKKPRSKPRARQTATLHQVKQLEEQKKEVTVKFENTAKEVDRLKEQLQQANQVIKTLEAQLETARETIGNLNETIALLKLNSQPRAKKELVK